MKLAVEMVERIIADGDVKGVHFCTLNLERSVRKILEELRWTKQSPDTSNRLIIVRTFIYYLHIPSLVPLRIHRTSHMSLS